MLEKDDISLTFKIERSNILNAFTPKGMTLTGIRFLAIYQSKINARNPETRKVIFGLQKFCDILEIKELNIKNIKNTIDSILCNPVHVPNGKNGFTAFPLFNKCNVFKDEKKGDWLVEVECHPDALPYMFEMKRNYFTYELWNALTLSSLNQVRMYEILKQYEKIGSRTIQLDDLKRMLGISHSKQSEYRYFRRDVLEVCKTALAEKTDITFTFEPMRVNRKVQALKFTIEKNKDFKDNLRLKEFINPKDLEDIMDEPYQPIPIPEPQPTENEVNAHRVAKSICDESPLETLYLSCNKEYTLEQLFALSDYVRSSGVPLNVSVENYIYSIYRKIKIEGNKVNSLYKYTFTIIESQMKEYIFGKPSTSEPPKPSNPPQKRKETSYDIEEFKRLVEVRAVDE
jgi:hypothetical protein